MTETRLSSPTREVVIGPDRPFVLIGERINPTGRKALAVEMKAGDFSRVMTDAIAQVEAGAHMLDVNAGIPLADEPGILAETIKLVQSLVDVPLSIDSSIVEALEAGLAVYQGKPLVNRVTGEEERLERVLPLVRKYGAAVVAISNDDTGISEDPDVRFAVAKKIVERAADHGIPREDVVVDPLVMPIGAMRGAGRQVFQIVRRLRDELKVNSSCGASNVSFGLPNREGINGPFLAMAMASGLTSAITNPLMPDVLKAIMAADVLNGNDPDAARWIRAHRAAPVEGVQGRRVNRRARGGPGSARTPVRPVEPASPADPPMATTAPDPLIIFTPSGRRGNFPVGTTILDAGRALGVDIDSVCGGRGICGRCQVQQSVGEFAKHGITSRPEHLGPWTAKETEYEHEREKLAAGRRLSCSTEICGDAVIDVPPESQVHRQVVRKGVDVRDFVIDPAVRLHYVEIEPADLASPGGELAKILAALETEWQLTDLETDLHVIQALQPALEAGGHKVTVAVHDGRHLTAVWSGFHDRVLGVAIDVGSTTIAGHLTDLVDGAVLASSGVMNPQIRFGEDLMSRVSYAMMHDDGAVEMTRVVREAIDALLSGLAASAGANVSDILELTIVGNPIMHHLLLGIDPIPLGSAPFALATDRSVRIRAAELGLNVNPGARVYVLPCIAGHVGADTAGAILAETPHLAPADRIRLVVDVGTNAEIVLGNRERLLAASSPTGPAFEGAQISGGQRAAPGAIERVRIDRKTLEPRVRVIGSDSWSDEPKFKVALRKTGVTGICGSGIIEAVAELYLAGVITPDGIIDGGLAERSPRIVPDGRTFSYVLRDASPRLVITQNDVRAIQLAKAALYAGVRLLMDHAGIEAVDEIRLAGAFGSHIDTTHAMVLGLIPDCDLAHVGSAGNAAGTGALIALLSVAARREIEEVVRTVEKIETAVEPRFQEHFVEALAIPHKTAPLPNLATVVDLPAGRGTAAETSSGGGAGSSVAPQRRRRPSAASARRAQSQAIAPEEIR